MGIQLNIKDAATVKLARDLAGRTGRSVTETIRTALEAEANRRDEDFARRMAEIDTIVKEFQTHLDPAWRDRTAKELIDSIYDEGGLPA